jgi:hypothetical protein
MLQGERAILLNVMQIPLWLLNYLIGKQSSTLVKCVKMLGIGKNLALLYKIQ